MKCNQCGKKLIEKNGIIVEDYIQIQKKWGYFSKKDGVTQEFVLCETCSDMISDTFRIPSKCYDTIELV